MTYDQLLSMYRRIGRQVGTNAQNDAFNKWADSIQYAAGVNNWDEIPNDVFDSGRVDPTNPQVPAQDDGGIPADRLNDLIARANAGDQSAIDELTNAGYTQSEGPTATQPLEQALLNQVLPGLIADVTNDANRAQMADAQRAIAQGDYDLARSIIQRATSGQQLQTELGTADAAAASKRTALDAALAKLTAAQAPLSEARLGEAEGQITGVNLGLERTLDQLDAQRAEQGYVGGSTSDINAATRATIGARQNAAQLMGAAKTANATDVRDISGFGANQGYSIENALADQRQSLTNADYGRSLQAALSLPQLQNQFLTTTQNIDSQRNAGLLRTQQALNWWAANSQAPTATYNPAQTDTYGNDLAGLGANLTGAAISIGNANKWWQTPNTNNTPAVSSPTGYFTPNGNPGVQTDWSTAFASP